MVSSCSIGRHSILIVTLIGTDRFVTEKNVKYKQELLHSRKQILVTLVNLAR